MIATTYAVHTTALILACLPVALVLHRRSAKRLTVRAAAEGEARLFLEAAYPEDEMVEVTEAGDVREYPDTELQASTTGL